MKHAGDDTLASISSFLDQIRAIPELSEKKTGVFYCKSRAFLHFHEDAAGIFADVRLDGSEFDRLPANTLAQQRKILASIKRVVLRCK